MFHRPLCILKVANLHASKNSAMFHLFKSFWSQGTLKRYFVHTLSVCHSFSKHRGFFQTLILGRRA